MKDDYHRIALEGIRDIASPGAKAEIEFKKSTEEFLAFFLPTRVHINALDLDKFLILGSRGAGKTYLFGSLAKSDLQENLLKFFSRHHPWLNRTFLIVGFGNIPGIEQGVFPPLDVLESLAGDFKNKDKEWRIFWLGLLLGCLLRSGGILPTSEAIPEELKQSVRNTSRPSEWIPLVKSYLEKIYTFLDELDCYLENQNRWIMVIYDGLDKLSLSYYQLAPPIRALLSLWLDGWSRWSRIRGKIFLRTDLFRGEFLSFPDASKLKAHQIELSWTPLLLYFLVFKRMANVSETLRKFFEEIGALMGNKHPVFGWLPKPEESSFKKIIEEMIGTYMGSGPKKGRTYNWIPNHLQDANGVIMPRPMLNLFHFAACGRLERGIEKLRGRRLFLPEDLTGALKEVSEHRIGELLEEFPWLKLVKTHFQGLLMPVKRDDLLERLSFAVRSHQEERWPSRDPVTIINLLCEIGILEERSDGRFNVPDIYLFGFGMKRRGGPKRPKHGGKQMELAR